MENNVLNRLNPVQLQAVKAVNGPVIVLAGAGSGKTRVLTSKIAYLIREVGIKPHHILAMTFTNKAANEMKSRVEQYLNTSIDKMWIGTFHSNCARILRSEAPRLGYTSNFSIYDTSDQEKLIKNIMQANSINPKNVSPRAIQNKISYLKNNRISAEDFEKDEEAVDEFNTILKTIYWHYTVQMRRNNAMDFDDLLLNVLYLLENHEEVLTFYRNKFKYILIDEYQDTNLIQYHIIKLLGQAHRNVTIVGDDDQSIYKWRGADVRNIFRFVEDFPEHEIYRLEQNYRSTPEILKVANHVIKNNSNRMEKELWTENPSQEKPVVIQTMDARSEAQRILTTIMELRSEFGYDYEDFAILYRTNAQSRYFEEVLQRRQIPYLIFGGIRFYERREIKDMLAYLKYLVNPDDTIALERIINVPPRKIGDKTIQQLREIADRENITIDAIISNLGKYSDNLKNVKSLMSFMDMVSRWRQSLEECTPVELFDMVLDESGLLDYYSKETKMDYIDREENIEQLRVSMEEFFQYNPQYSTLEEFLQYISLITDVDNPSGSLQGVKLMTIHAAKGLEFPVVFVTGLEEKLFPHQLSYGSMEELEEERRLFYVAVTRSKELLYLSYAGTREKYSRGQGNWSEPRDASRFLGEIPDEFVKRIQTVVNDNTFTNNNRFSSGLTIGSNVLHQTFGKGVVMGVEGSGPREKVTVLFEDNTTRTFFSSMAKLEIV